MKSIYVKIACALLAFLAVSQVAVSLRNSYISGGRESGSGEYIDFAISDETFSNGTFAAKLHVSIGSAESGTIRVAAIPFSGHIPPQGNRTVYIYFDYERHSSAISESMWLALADHTWIELVNRGYNNLEPVNALELRMAMEEDPNGIVFIPSGTFPDAVYPGGNGSFVKGWLSGGGTLVWIGDMFGYYSDAAGKPLDGNSPDNPGHEGHMAILGKPLIYAIDEGDIIATDESPVSSALMLRYPYTQRGASLSLLYDLGGEAIGRITESSKRVSIAYVPVGNGSLVLFGHGIYNDDGAAAWEVAQLIWSGVLDRGAIRANTSFAAFDVEKGESVEKTVEFAVGQSARSVILAAFSQDPWNLFYSKSYFSASD